MSNHESNHSQLVKTAAAEVVLNQLGNDHTEGGSQGEDQRGVAQLRASLDGGGGTLTVSGAETGRLLQRKWQNTSQ